MKTLSLPLVSLLLPVLVLASCKPAATGSSATKDQSPAADPCSNTDGALNDTSFVFVSSPRPGDRVAGKFEVKGCSRTFESTVNWILKGRDGKTLASGHTGGGGVDGPKPFTFNVESKVSTRQVGSLEVFEEDASGGEGFPPPRCVIPVVLQP